MLLLYTILCVLGLCAQTSKLSPYVRQAMMTRSVYTACNKTKACLGNVKQPTITAFVRTTDIDVLHQQGCHIYAQWSLTPSPSPIGDGGICIASIPLDKLSTLAMMPQIQRIEAGESCGITNDTTAIVTRTKEAWNVEGAQNSHPLGGLRGTGVVVGIMDIGFDLTHPTFYSSDGQTYRIKQMWDQLDMSEGGEAVIGKTKDNDTIYVGRQYVGNDSLLNRKHSYDGLTQTHGTHTAGTAAGSGAPFLAAANTQHPTPITYSGMAPDADICLVCNATGDNASLIPESEQYRYTTATDMLGFKYIFDYAKSVGKPCVINFSEGAHDDLYQSGLYGEVLSKMVGAGCILCSSAGNEGSKNTYIHKSEGETEKGAFLVKAASNTAIYILRSPKPVQIRLSLYKDNAKALDKDYDLTELAMFPDSLQTDSIDINGDTIVVMLQTYPSYFDENFLATDIILQDLGKENFGYATPVSLTLLGNDNDIEAFCSGGYFTKNELDSSLDDCEKTHNVLFPGSSKDAVSVGNSAYRTTFINTAGEWRSPYPTADNNGVISRYSSVGPAISGEIKPDVVAPGMNIISAFNSFYREKNPESSVSDDICDFTYNTRHYQWHAMSGTSMSTPAVTGIIALWLQICPTLTPDQVKDVIAHTATHHDDSLEYPNSIYGWGQIDAMAGVEYIQQTYTGIREIENGELKIENSDAVYTLDGRKVNSKGNLHGVFIVINDGNVRKVVMR